VRDDASFLRAARKVVSPGGHVLLAVPALPALFGSLDRAFAHHRRYTKPLLASLLTEAGFHNVRLRWFNADKDRKLLEALLRRKGLLTDAAAAA
jgi:hypothetical protein